MVELEHGKNYMLILFITTIWHPLFILTIYIKYSKEYEDKKRGKKGIDNRIQSRNVKFIYMLSIIK